MEAVMQNVPTVLGKYSPENGDLSRGFIEGFDYLGNLLNENGELNSIVFQSEDGTVAILTLDIGYGTPSITTYTEEILEEINERLIK